MYLWSDNAHIAFPGAQSNIWEYEVECVLSSYKVISKIITGNIDIIIILILPTSKCT